MWKNPYLNVQLPLLSALLLMVFLQVYFYIFVKIVHCSENLIYFLVPLGRDPLLPSAKIYMYNKNSVLVSREQAPSRNICHSGYCNRGIWLDWFDQMKCHSNKLVKFIVRIDTKITVIQWFLNKIVLTCLITVILVSFDLARRTLFNDTSLDPQNQFFPFEYSGARRIKLFVFSFSAFRISFAIEGQ